MAMMMALKHVDKLSGGRKRFRRRFPKDVVPVVGKTFMQVAMRTREGADMVQEHRALMVEFDRMVSVARGETSQTAREQWVEDKSVSTEMLSTISGLPKEDDRREVLGHELIKAGYRPSLIREVISPAKNGPKHTLEDARRLYLKERVGDDKPKTVRLERICKRMVEVLGPLRKFPLLNLKREHARLLRDAMLSTTKKDGNFLSVASVRVVRSDKLLGHQPLMEQVIAWEQLPALVQGLPFAASCPKPIAARRPKSLLRFLGCWYI